MTKIKNLEKISPADYSKLQDAEVINGTSKRWYFMYTGNAFLSKCLTKTNKRPIDYNERNLAKRKIYERRAENERKRQYFDEHGTFEGYIPSYETPNYGYITGIYDHMLMRRLKTPKGSLTIEFACPYNDVESFCKEINEGWTDKDYEILLINPLLYQYRYKTLSVANIFKSKRSSKEIYEIAGKINGWFEDNVDQPLFYLLPDV